VKNGKFLVARRLPGGAMSEKWEFPGGKVEPGESDRAALQREFEEEFSVGVRVGEAVAKARFEHGGRSIDLGAFEVFLDSEEFVLTEHTEWRWAEFDEIAALDFADSDRKLLPELSDRFRSC
jgi:8-oxo-dGTP diphosphatase